MVAQALPLFLGLLAASISAVDASNNCFGSGAKWKSLGGADISDRIENDIRTTVCAKAAKAEFYVGEEFTADCTGYDSGSLDLGISYVGPRNQIYARPAVGASVPGYKGPKINVDDCIVEFIKLKTSCGSGGSAVEGGASFAYKMDPQSHQCGTEAMTPIKARRAITGRAVEW
jgi:hypothetical protein